MNQFASVPAGNILPSTASNNIYASTPGGVVAGYVPKQGGERAYFEALWSAANPSGNESLGGPAAVEFFQKSGVDNGFLRQVIFVLIILIISCSYFVFMVRFGA